MKIDKNKTTVGELVKDNFHYSDLMNQYGIDFCCNGHDTIEVASAKAGVDPDEVVAALESLDISDKQGAIPFDSFPKDLLIDYILKIHHRGIREKGPGILALVDKVVSVHGASHPELSEVRALFSQALPALDSHLNKEETILFPHLYTQFEAIRQGLPWGPFHSGSVENPIIVMMEEHDVEGERFKTISQLTNDYTAPEDACNSYRLMLEQIRSFQTALHEHIHLENNILFPWAIKMEKQEML